VDALNLDKTGTITDGGIAYDHLDMIGDPSGERAATQALYDCCNEEQPNGTGLAVLAGLKSQGYDAGRIAARIPFSSARKWSAVAYTSNATNASISQDKALGESADASDITSAAGTIASSMAGVWIMGAPEVILSALDGDYTAVLKRINGYANEGNRVLLVAHGRAIADTESWVSSPTLDPKATPMAIVLCAEQIRPDAESTLAWFREQGVRCRVISGDNPVTVGAIARKVKLTGEREPVAMDARELPKDADELARVLENVDVLGRVLPNQKKAIVQALHTQGHVVAMTGDGVNDALAIKEADLGIAMGNASPATKAVAQVVLVDSKFSHLSDVVARGRQVMANMERVASLFLVKTVYSALISLGVVLTQIPYPYLPRHITYIGGLTIGLPAFILALAPNTRRYIPGFLKRVVKFALPGGIATALSVLLAAWFLPGIMGWNVTGNAADLSALRATSAIILFVMGVFVLARVARPMTGWRCALVAVFAAAGIIGAFIPFVADFFALIIPTGATLLATVLALVGAAVIFTLSLWLVPRVGHACAQFLRKHGVRI
jgi:cation-transporting ATPase E